MNPPHLLPRRRPPHHRYSKLAPDNKGLRAELDPDHMDRHPSTRQGTHM
jgi:hypothetical protein